MTNYNDLISALRSDSSSREKAIRDLVSDKTLRSKIKAMVLAKGGKPDDANIVYTDTMVAFIKAISTKSPTINTNLESYIVGIARYKWYDLLKSRTSKLDVVNIDNVAPPIHEPEQYTLLRNTEKWSMIQKVLSKMAKRCKDVILLWAGGYSMNEIAKKLSYKSEGMARKKKSECMKELLLYLGNNPKLKEQLR